MRIGIVDADLIGRKRHRFPNLACMKISGFHKRNGDTVNLLDSYVEIPDYDRVYVSCVFTDTEVPAGIEELPNVQVGGTGFAYDSAEPLPDEIEHGMPDYTLYQEFAKNLSRNDAKFYTQYSIGFMTRGCFRKCAFCVNRKSSRVVVHSPLAEFYDPSKPKICLLDDNVLGFKGWRDVFEQLIDSGKPFRFHQGMDERVLTDEKCEVLFSCKYDGDFTFAFDNIADYKLIESKLKIIRRHTDKIVRFYVLVGFDWHGRYDQDFWDKDIADAFKRIDLLRRYKCLPYIMRFNRYVESPYRGMYVNLARWVNQPSIFKKKSLVEFTEMDNSQSPPRYLREWLQTQTQTNPIVIDQKWSDFN